MSNYSRYIPLGLLILLMFIIAIALARPLSPNFGTSPLLDKALPVFEAINRDNQTITTEDLIGKPVIINFFASWCTPCKLEHPILLSASKNKSVRVIGIIYGQDPNLDTFLQENGNPYEMILRDPGGAIALKLGVSGVPETFALDGDGLLRFHQAGALSETSLKTLLKNIGVKE